MMRTISMWDNGTPTRLKCTSIYSNSSMLTFVCRRACHSIPQYLYIRRVFVLYHFECYINLLVVKCICYYTISILKKTRATINVHTTVMDRWTYTLTKISYILYVVVLYSECYYLGGSTSKSTLYSIPLILVPTCICWRCVSRPKNKNFFK